MTSFAVENLPSNGIDRSWRKPLRGFRPTVLAILFGVFGQSLRAVVGLKKQADVASASQKALKDVFSWTTLGVSLFIGAVAGVAGYLSLRFGPEGTADFTQSSTVLGIIAAGYAGTDFIEGFMKKYLPGP